MDVGEYFSLHPTTTHSAVAYLDRLHLSGFSRHEWQMLAISCILIAGTFILLTWETSTALVLFSSTPSVQHTALIFPSHPPAILMQSLFTFRYGYFKNVNFPRNQQQHVYKLPITSISSTPLLHCISTTLYSTAKYNEREEDVPDLLTIEDIAKQPIPNDILLKYELWTLQKMGWKLTGKISIISRLHRIFLTDIPLDV